MVLRQSEELKVNKTASDSESGYAPAAGIAQVIFDLLFDVEDTAFLVEHGLHDRSGRVISCLQKRLPGAVDDRVIGIDVAGYKFFHNELYIAEVV